MEPETITITISPVDGKYQFAMNGVRAPELHDSMGAAARSAWLTVAAAETVVRSGPEGDRLEPVGLAIIMKAILGICFDPCSERRVSIGRYIKGGASEENLAKLRLWVAEAKRTQRTTDFDMVRSYLTIIEAEETLAKVAERAQRREQVKVLPPDYEYVDAATLGHGCTSASDFAFKAPDGRVYGPYCNKASMHGDAWVHATDPDLFIAPTPGADEILTPEEYEAALACEVSDTEIYNAIDQAMREALASRAPFFRVSVPSVALDRAKAMLEKWDVRATGRPTMRERGGHLVHLKVSPKPPAFEVFLVGDVVVVAEDVDNARLLTSSMTSDPRMRQLLMAGFESAEPRQVDSSEVLEVFLWDGYGGAPVTHSAGEWAKAQGRGVLGPIMGSALEKKFRVREHREECNKIPYYYSKIEEMRAVRTKSVNDAQKNHLYFVGPNLYVAESEDAALQHHDKAVVDSKGKLDELRQSVIEEAPGEAEMVSRHLNAMLVEVSKTYDIRRVPEDETLPDIVELSEEENVQTSHRTYEDWRRGKVGSVGLLRSYYQEVITPHVEAIMGAAAVAGERRLQEVREKLGIGDGQ